MAPSWSLTAAGSHRCSWLGPERMWILETDRPVWGLADSLLLASSYVPLGHLPNLSRLQSPRLWLLSWASQLAARPPRPHL